MVISQFWNILFQSVGNVFGSLRKCHSFNSGAEEEEKSGTEGGGQDRRRKKSWNSHGIFFFLVSIAVKVFSFTDNKTTSWIGGDKIINRRNRDDEKSPSVRRNNQNVEPNFFNKVPFPNFSIEVKKKKQKIFDEATLKMADSAAASPSDETFFWQNLGGKIIKTFPPLFFLFVFHWNPLLSPFL